MSKKSEGSFHARTITASEAIEQGTEPWQLRAIANSLERIGNSSDTYEIEYICNRKGDTRKATVDGLCNFSSRHNFKAARQLRTVAKMIELSRR